MPNQTLTDLEYKNVWTAEDRAIYEMGSREAYEASRARGQIKQLKRRIDNHDASDVDIATLQSNLRDWECYLAALTPEPLQQIAAE